MSIKTKKNILLVEDEVIVAMTDSINLKEYGYNVMHVLSGEKAIEVINDDNNEIDLILMDINLGKGMDGTETAKKILKEYDIPILFHSSYIEREIVEKTENITSYGYVVKDGITVLDASIKMAFRLYDAYQFAKKQKIENEAKKIELQTYEKRYRRLFESAKDGILILNADNGRIVDVNPYLIKMLGYTKEEFLKKNIWDVSAFKYIDYSKQLYKELQDKEYIRYEDIPLETSSGKSIHVEFVNNVYLVDNDRVIQCNIRDISTRISNEKKLTDDLNEKRALLREIQHRIKNSFNIIKSLISLRASAAHSEETKRTLEDLILRIISISDLYTLLHETDSFFDVPLDIYCHKIIDSLQNLSNNVTINQNLEKIIVQSNKAATIGMILVELLSNAIKYAYPENDKEGIVNVELRTINSKIVMIVKDNGVGLEKDFDLTKNESLGLHLVGAMVNQLDGEINFISEDGTKVIIEFPHN